MSDYLTPQAREHFERASVKGCVCGLCELIAALPDLEQQIREQVAREIEAKAPLAYYPHESGYEKYQGMKYAAKIARGEDQP